MGHGYRSYYLDTRDPPYPRIRVRWVDHKKDVRTYSQVKAEALEECRHHIEHWQGIARDFRALTKAEVDKEED